ncbi:MAG TPA: hypothetical protein VM260_11345, partial [Pirellula sp.]|nr:hypothetical protein [Pirellula sp.]
TGETEFLLFDSVASGGHPCGHLPMLARAQIMRAAIEEWERISPSRRVKPDKERPPMDPWLHWCEHWVRPDLVIRVKRRFALWDMAFMLQRLSTVDTAVDGCILDFDEPAIEERAAQFSFKIKLAHTAEFTFRWLGTDEKTGLQWYSIWCWDADKRAEICYTRHGHVAVKPDTFPDCKLHNIVVECIRLPRPAHIPCLAPSTVTKGDDMKMPASTSPWMWTPYKIRWDKDRANALKTIQDIEISCDENLQLSEIVPNSYLVATHYHASQVTNYYNGNGAFPLPLYNDPALLGSSSSTSTAATGTTNTTTAASAGNDTKQLTDIQHMFKTPCLSWLMLKARDDMRQKCKTPEEAINTIWTQAVTVAGREHETLPDPTPLPVYSISKLRADHQDLCSSWTDDHKRYMLTHPNA